MKKKKLARALGLFSIGLGLAEVMAPKKLGRMMGIKGNIRLMRSLGIREVTSGVGILTKRNPSNWLWARVGGDLMDLVLLGAAMKSKKRGRGRIAAAASAVAGVTALDLLAGSRYARR